MFSFNDVIELLFWLFGMCFFVRNAFEHLKKQLFTSQKLTKIGTVVFVFTLCTLCNLYFNSFRALFIFYFLNIVMFCTDVAYKRKQLRTFEQTSVSFLTKMVLQSRCGTDFLRCFAYAMESIEQKSRSEFRKIEDFVSFSQQKQQFRYQLSSFLANELYKIKKSGHKHAEKIKNLRDFLKICNRLRQKSRASSAQALTQTIFLTVVYTFTLSFTFISIPNFNSTLVLVSLALFSIGLVLIAYLAEKRSWKV